MNCPSLIAFCMSSSNHAIFWRILSLPPCWSAETSQIRFIFGVASRMRSSSGNVSRRIAPDLKRHDNAAFRNPSFTVSH